MPADHHCYLRHRSVLHILDIYLYRLCKNAFEPFYHQLQVVQRDIHSHRGWSSHRQAVFRLKLQQLLSTIDKAIVALQRLRDRVNITKEALDSFQSVDE